MMSVRTVPFGITATLPTSSITTTTTTDDDDDGNNHNHKNTMFQCLVNAIPSSSGSVETQQTVSQ